MNTSDKIYEVMCQTAQKLIDEMDKGISSLNDNQFNDLRKRIEKIHRDIEVYGKRFKK